MSEPKFTKGEWFVNHTGEHWNNPSIENYEICYSELCECVVDHVYELADANLIAEAPNMYREIEIQIEMMHKIMNTLPMESELFMEAAERIVELDAVLTKARGEA